MISEPLCCDLDFKEHWGVFVKCGLQSERELCEGTLYKKKTFLGLKETEHLTLHFEARELRQSSAVEPSYIITFDLASFPVAFVRFAVKSDVHVYITKPNTCPYHCQ